MAAGQASRMPGWHWGSSDLRLPREHEESSLLKIRQTTILSQIHFNHKSISRESRIHPTGISDFFLSKTTARVYVKCFLAIPGDLAVCKAIVLWRSSNYNGMQRLGQLNLSFFTHLTNLFSPVTLAERNLRLCLPELRPNSRTKVLRVFLLAIHSHLY